MARFATSARAVDMLGRQQIATVPTALSELFKNAHDAYARRVRADYFPDERILLLRDDGVGMSSDDFLQRWLVLGTDSKAADSSRPPPPRPTGARIRPTMGEKGIGRLAVASIGPQVVVVTRPDRGPADRSVVVALVQWSMFETPGLLLDEINIPVMEIRGWPDQDVLDELARQVLQNLAKLTDRVPASLKERVVGELKSLRLPARGVTALPGPQLDDDGHGTHFLITSVHEELDAAMAPTTSEQQADQSTDFERLLIGFTNTMLKGGAGSPMATSFFVYRPRAVPIDLIAPKTFWVPEDFSHVDHDIQGEFDELGRFHGTVSVYGRDPLEHVVVWPRGMHKPPRCGPFKIRIGYLQGNPKESRLDAVDYASTQAKLARIGGLYVYRDGIRVLPYGSAEVDYLGIEERRSRNAGRYYFSYRRMFGAIEISTDANPLLRDKASREGLMDNVAFRDFKSILENFLVQTAADFFRSGGRQSEDFVSERIRLRDQERQRRNASARLAKRRDQYAAAVQTRLDELESGRARQKLRKVVAGLRQRIDQIDIRNPEKLAELERTARSEIQSLADNLVLAEPDGIALTDDQHRDLAAFRAREHIFQMREVPQVVAELVAVVEGAASEQRVLRALVTARFATFDEMAENTLTHVRVAAEETRAELSKIAAEVQRQVAERVHEAGEAVKQVRAELVAIQGAAAEQQRSFVRVQQVAMVQEAALAQLRSRLEQVLNNEAAEDTRLLQERLLGLERQVDADVDLLLLGQAIQVIDHELEQTVGTARNALARLRPLSRENVQLRQNVEQASNAFEHLDGYLRLFTPLQRRLRRQRTEIPGTRIVTFLDSLLGERLRRHDVHLRATRPFRETVTHGFASTFLPVFVNLVDNAVHWAASQHPEGGGIVTLDVDHDDLIVCDNGAGVPERDMDVIFTKGFSRRVGGRGLGLSISQEALRREGWTLTVDPPDPSRPGATFRLHSDEEKA